MESPSALVSDTPAASSVMTPQPVRHKQGKFSKEETNFLKTHLPAYGALCEQLGKQGTGPRGTKAVKGCKKDWILSKVFPQFVKQFSSKQNDGPQLQSLQAVSYLFNVECLFRWNISRKYCDGSRIIHPIEVLARVREH